MTAHAPYSFELIFNQVRARESVGGKSAYRSTHRVEDLADGDKLLKEAYTREKVKVAMREVAAEYRKQLVAATPPARYDDRPTHPSTRTPGGRFIDHWAVETPRYNGSRQDSSITYDTVSFVGKNPTVVGSPGTSAVYSLLDILEHGAKPHHITAVRTDLLNIPDERGGRKPSVWHPGVRGAAFVHTAQEATIRSAPMKRLTGQIGSTSLQAASDNARQFAYDRLAAEIKRARRSTP